MNLGQLVTHVANRVGNDAMQPVYIQFVNQIQYDFCSRYQFSWRSSLPVSLTTIPNQKYLNPSAYFPLYGEPLDAMNLTNPIKMRYTPVYDLYRGDPDYALANPTRAGVPLSYAIDWNEQDSSMSRIWLYPMPNGAYPISIRYLRNPPEVSNTSSALFIPAKYHYVVAAGVESLAWELDEDLASASAANQRYEAGIKRAIDEEARLNDFEPIFESRINYIDWSYPFSDF